MAILTDGSVYGSQFVGNDAAATPANVCRLVGQVVDGATAYGAKIGNVNDLTTAGAKIVGFYSDNLSTEKAYIDKDGGAYFGGNVGFGTTLPTAFFDIEKSGTAKSTVDFVEITNLVNVADMDATGTGILFNQFYYDAATPAVLPSARIAAVCENDWTSAQSNSSLDFYTRMRPNTELKMRLNSRGTLMFGGTDMNANAVGALHLFYTGTTPGAHTDDSILIYGIDSSDGATTLGLYPEQDVEVGVAVATHKLKVWIGGVEYYWGLLPV